MCSFQNGVLLMSNYYKLCRCNEFLLLDLPCRQFSGSVVIFCQDARLQSKISFLKMYFCCFGFPDLRFPCFLLLLFYLLNDTIIIPAITATSASQNTHCVQLTDLAKSQRAFQPVFPVCFQCHLWKEKQKFILRRPE